MPKAKAAKLTSKRTKVKDLPKDKQTLTAKSMKKVKGGGFIMSNVRKAGKDQQEF